MSTLQHELIVFKHVQKTCNWSNVAALSVWPCANKCQHYWHLQLELIAKILALMVCGCSSACKDDRIRTVHHIPCLSLSVLALGRATPLLHVLEYASGSRSLPFVLNYFLFFLLRWSSFIPGCVQSDQLWQCQQRKYRGRIKILLVGLWPIDYDTDRSEHSTDELHLPSPVHIDLYLYILCFLMIRAGKAPE